MRVDETPNKEVTSGITWCSPVVDPSALHRPELPRSSLALLAMLGSSSWEKLYLRTCDNYVFLIRYLPLSRQRLKTSLFIIVSLFKVRSDSAVSAWYYISLHLPIILKTYQLFIVLEHEEWRQTNRRKCMRTLNLHRHSFARGCY